jgi:hypothetical protein
MLRHHMLHPRNITSAMEGVGETRSALKRLVTMYSSFVLIEMRFDNQAQAGVRLRVSISAIMENCLPDSTASQARSSHPARENFESQSQRILWIRLWYEYLTY